MFLPSLSDYLPRNGGEPAKNYSNNPLRNVNSPKPGVGNAGTCPTATSKITVGHKRRD